MKKQHYETPTTDVLVVRFEDSILQSGSPDYSSNGTQKGTAVMSGWTDGWDDDNN